MSRKTFCTLSAANLLHNLNVIRAQAPRSKIIAMVKANAYGHGMAEVAARLDGQVDALGVASIDEALALRKAGVKAPVVLMEGVFTPDELAQAAEHNFWVTFHSRRQIDWLAHMQLPTPLTAWLKINTGMGRLGFPAAQAADVLRSLSGSASLRQPVGILSHFACADEPGHPLNRKQIDAFRAIAQDHAGPKSLCNSAAIFAFPDLHFDWVRPGLALYGASPLAGRSAEELGLKPVMTFSAELIAVQNAARGSSVGYGARFVCPEDMKVGIISVGYGDGYPRSVAEGMPVLVNGVRCPLIGRVSMDMAAVDLRPCANAVAGAEVVLWGKGLPVEDVSGFTDHINYDLLTGMQNRPQVRWTAD